MIEASEQAKQCAFAGARWAEDDGPIGGESTFHMKVEAAAAGVEREAQASLLSLSLRARFAYWSRSPPGEERSNQEQKRGTAGGGVVEVLDLVVEDDRERARGAGNVAAEHEDDAEFADGVKEAEHDARREASGAQAEEEC